MLGFHWLAVRKVKGSGERPQLFPSTGAKKVLVFTICPVLRLFHNLRLSRHGHEHMSQHSVGLKWPQNGPGRQTVGRKVLLLGGGHMKTRGGLVTDWCIVWMDDSTTVLEYVVMIVVRCWNWNCNVKRWH